MPAISLEIENTSLDPDSWDQVCDECFQFLYDITPVDEGTCRDSLDMSKDDTSVTFTYDVEYASYLDEGWSKQAPNGMFGPLLQELPSIIAGYR